MKKRLTQRLRVTATKLFQKAIGSKYRWQKVAALTAVAVLVAALVWPQGVHASTATLVPDGDVTTQWTPSTGTTHYTLIDEGATDNTTDFISVATGVTTASVDEWTMTTIGGSGYGASQIVGRIYWQSTTNLNGSSNANIDTIGLVLRSGGTSLASTTCSLSAIGINIWTACTVTATGSYTPTQIDALQMQITRNIVGTGGTSGRTDNLKVANAYATVTYNASPNAPTLSTPTSGATGVSTTPQFTFRTTDSESDPLEYEIDIYQSNCSTLVLSTDQLTSQTGWSGQDQMSGAAYTGSSTITSSTMATYTYQGTLSAGTTYCWKTRAVDPSGSDIYGAFSATQLFTTNNVPSAPTLSTPSSGATSVSVSPAFTLRTTDAENDYLQYKIILYQSNCSTVVATVDQTSSQTGWSGQDQQTSTAYTGSSTITSSTMATYTYTGTLSPGTTYCWKAQAIDPGGSNSFGSFSSTQSFTTNDVPAAPTLSTPSSGATGQATTNLAFTLKTTDPDSDYLEYKIFLYQSDCSTAVATFDQTSSQTGWSGQDANGGNAYVGSSSLGSSTLATYTYTGTLTVSTTYCWQAQAIDPAGSNAFGSLSATQLFTTNSGATMVNIGGGTNIKGGTRFGN